MKLNVDLHVANMHLSAFKVEFKIFFLFLFQYRFYGEQVVKACIENGAHHLDISGEPQVYCNTVKILDT